MYERFPSKHWLANMLRWGYFVNTNFIAEKYEYRCRKELPVRLRKLRLAKGVSSKALGPICDTHHDAIRRYERGECMPKCETLVKIADFFNVSVDYLCGRADQ